MTDQFNTHPQPRTFAPSKEDVLQNLMYFFGAPVSPEKLKDYSEHHAMTYHFPGARRQAWPALASRTRLGPRDPSSVLAEARLPLPLPAFAQMPTLGKTRAPLLLAHCDSCPCTHAPRAPWFPC